MKTDKENELQEKYKDEFQAFAIDRFSISPELVSKFMNTFTTNLHNVRFAYFTAREHSQAEITSLKAELETWKYAYLGVQIELEKAKDLVREELENRGIKFPDREKIWEERAKEFLKIKEGANE